MPDFKAIFEKLKDAFLKLPTVNKIIFGVIILFFIIGLVFISRFSSKPTNAYLYQSALSPEDYARVTKKLSEWNIKFDTKDDKYIIVKDDKESRTLRMRLGQEGIIPNNVKGWELFDVQRFTTTDFERNVNLQRAIKGEMERHLKLLNDIDDVTIDIAFPKETIYSEYQAPITASVLIIPSPYSDITENKKKIQGIVNLVAYGIPGLKKENVVVVDDKGNTLSDLLIPDDASEGLKLAQEQLKIIAKERSMLQNKIKTALKGPFGEKRLVISVEVEFDWTKRKIEANKIIPIVLKQDDPTTPYDDSKIEISTPISEKNVEEVFKGPAYIPEGAPGTENNVPPGLKDKIDRYTHYNKNEIIRNYDTSKEKVLEEKNPYEIKKVSVAVAIDGIWEVLKDKNGEPILTNNGKVARIYHPVDDKTLKDVEAWVKAAIGFNVARGDSVVVKHISFDRTEEFEKEDERIRKKIQLKRTLLASIFVLIILFIGTLVYRVIMKEIERKRREREAELERQQQAMREAALRAAEQQEATIGMSIEEQARQELLQNAINISKERPEDVAKLIRTWIQQQ